MDRSVFTQLRKNDVALVGKNKNQPLILFSYHRWMMVQFGVVVNRRFTAKKGISNLHFLSPARARKIIHEWMPYSLIKPFDDISPVFGQEIAVKVLPTAEDYGPLIQQGFVQLVVGHTSDTLSVISEKDKDIHLSITLIQTWMDQGITGPFLHFERTFDLYQPPK